jgi:hypothetical protein
MSSPSETRPSKRRIGRKRLAPLPPGPDIQFVVASHPDDFKDGATMRNVRSHVMYKHKEHRGSSPSEKRKSGEGSKTSAAPTRTPSRTTSTSDGVLVDNVSSTTSPATRPSTVWDEEFYHYTSGHATDPVRTLAARIISAASEAPARTASVMFEQASECPSTDHSALTQEPLASLKQEHINSTTFFCHGRSRNTGAVPYC